MTELTFVTTNKHKVREIEIILAPIGIQIKQINIDYPEDKEASVEEVAKTAAYNLARKLKKTVIVEDTGIYFSAYRNFPGSMPKFVFNSLGYDGIFRLLRGKDKQAYFKTVIGYCEPKGESILFSGIMRGSIAAKTFDEKKDVMPYERIFIPAGMQKPLSSLTQAEKGKISHRGKATRKLLKYLKQ